MGSQCHHQLHLERHQNLIYTSNCSTHFSHHPQMKQLGGKRKWSVRNKYLLESFIPHYKRLFVRRHVASLEKDARENRKGMGGNTMNDFPTWCRQRPAANKNIKKWIRRAFRNKKWDQHNPFDVHLLWKVIHSQMASISSSWSLHSPAELPATATCMFRVDNQGNKKIDC